MAARPDFAIVLVILRQIIGVGDGGI
jgi:hypothetical protein